MKVTFPHMGNLYICIKVLMEELGIDYMIPPFNNKTTLEIGTRYVPECACLPLKITTGTLIQAYNLGADTVLMAGGCGPCRFGYYCAAIAPAGVTSMDTTLLIISESTDNETAIISFSNGLILSTLVPILVPLIYGLP
jgi:predicted nucleotide-binding protein (sugar kinase/HSP70/actin superfamily)